MSDRSDFYVGMGQAKEWIGSCKAWGFQPAIDASWVDTEQEYREMIAKQLPEFDAGDRESPYGYPIADHAYTWHNGALYQSDCLTPYESWCLFGAGRGGDVYELLKSEWPKSQGAGQ